MKEYWKSCKDDCTVIFKLYWKGSLIEDYWLPWSALGFGKETKMGYYMKDYCQWLCLCLSTALGAIITKLTTKLLSG